MIQIHSAGSDSLVRLSPNSPPSRFHPRVFFVQVCCAQLFVGSIDRSIIEVAKNSEHGIHVRIRQQRRSQSSIDRIRLYCIPCLQHLGFLPNDGARGLGLWSCRILLRPWFMLYRMWVPFRWACLPHSPHLVSEKPDMPNQHGSPLTLNLVIVRLNKSAPSLSQTMTMVNSSNTSLAATRERRRQFIPRRRAYQHRQLRSL